MQTDLFIELTVGGATTKDGAQARGDSPECSHWILPSDRGGNGEPASRDDRPAGPLGSGDAQNQLDRGGKRRQLETSAPSARRPVVLRA